MNQQSKQLTNARQEFRAYVDCIQKEIEQTEWKTGFLRQGHYGGVLIALKGKEKRVPHPVHTIYRTTQSTPLLTSLQGVMYPIDYSILKSVEQTCQFQGTPSA